MTNDSTKGPGAVEAWVEDHFGPVGDEPCDMCEGGTAYTFARTIDQQIADLRRERDDAEARARHSQEKRVEAEAAAESWAHQAGVAIGERMNAERERDAARDAIRRGGAVREDGMWHRFTCIGFPDCSYVCEAQRLALREQPTTTRTHEQIATTAFLEDAPTDTAEGEADGEAN